MADVFISYKTEDRPAVEVLAAALRDAGFSVWWDRGLGADTEWYKQISEQLGAADVVLAVWSNRSSDSRWVYSEADEADKANKLVNVRLDSTLPPPPFNRLQCLDLVAWTGEPKDERFQPLVDALRRVQARNAGEVVADRPLPQDTAAARAWLAISQSLDPSDYRRFLERYAETPQAEFAQQHFDQLQRWRELTKTSESVREFQLDGPFRALAKAVADYRERFEAPAMIGARAGLVAEGVTEGLRGFDRRRTLILWSVVAFVVLINAPNVLRSGGEPLFVFWMLVYGVGGGYLLGRWIVSVLPFTSMTARKRKAEELEARLFRSADGVIRDRLRAADPIQALRVPK